MDDRCEGCRYYQLHYNLMDGEEFMGCDKFFWEKCPKEAKEKAHKEKEYINAD